MKEMVGGCCVCSDERGWPDNPLVYCDGNGCTVAVHQACYGIVTVPTGPWYCRKCESPDTKGKVKCELCPSKAGALKRTDTGGWAHVVCALYIPEVRFGNVTSMEPIVLRLIPPERYNKHCYICQDSNKCHRASAGACMQCNKSGCKQQFHVTCAQSLGLLCEEAGNYLDNVKYCGYCQHHYNKLPGRKSSHGGSTSGKNTFNSSKTPTYTNPSSAAGGSTPSGAKVTPTSASPSPSKTSEPMGVISSVASACATAGQTTSSVATSSVVLAPSSKPVFQESVITNAEAMETKQTKKRKAVSQANAQVGSARATTTPKVETETPAPAMFSNQEPLRPPPAYGQAALSSPRHTPSPRPGTSGVNKGPDIRSPVQPPTPAEPGHLQHGVRSWAGLNISYESQQDSNKLDINGVTGPGKDAVSGPASSAAPPPTIRNKKSAALTASVVTMANSTPANSQASAAPQSLASVRKQSQATPSSISQETVKDSPPSSPSSDHPLKPKMEPSTWVSRMGSAPHMLGNELNPESGAAARLQEHLTAELAAHAAGGAPQPDHLVPPPLVNKAQTASSGSVRTGSLRSGQGAHSLEQLLELQWEQGSQFLMEQTQHTSLLSYLHQLRAENVRLEEHVGGLVQRRDHLLAVNARLAIPLSTVNATPPEPVRHRDMSQPRAPPASMRTETVTSDRSHQAYPGPSPFSGNA